MVANPFFLRGPFSNSLFQCCARKGTERTTWDLYKGISKKGTLQNSSPENVGRLNSSSCFRMVSCHAFDELHVEEDEASFKSVSRNNGFDFLHAMEERGISADHRTYAWLLEGCLNFGSLIDVKKLHGRILKFGYEREPDLGCRLLDVYLAHGDLDDATKALDDMPDPQISSFSKLISYLVEKELSSRVFHLFGRMLAKSGSPDESIFGSVLKACRADNVGFRCAEQVHAKIIQYGFANSGLVCNPLIDLYSKFGLVDSAKLIFQNLHRRDNVSWVAMISGLSKNGHEKEAFMLFCEMHNSGIFPTPYALSSAISAGARIELFSLGEQLHGLIFKWGFFSETFISNALITLYFRWEDTISAERVFSKMQHKDGISYNSIISGLAQCGFSNRALQLFEKMQLDSFRPDCVTVASLLSACASITALYKGKQLHSYAIKAGFSSDIIVEGSLLDLYVKCSDMQAAHELFLMTETDNVVLWNVMLVAYGQSGDLSKSFHIFSQMQAEGMKPNQYTYPSILRTCTSVGALYLGEQIHTQVIKSGFQPNVYVSSVLIDMYAKHGELDTAMRILRRLPEEDVVSWTAMIAGYAQNDLCLEALLLFKDMQNRGIQSDNIGFSSAISACAGMQALSQGQQIHAQSCIFGYSEDLSIGNALVNLYARCGRIQDAYLAFEKIDHKDNISWNGLISGFAQSKYCEEALQVFARMNQAGIESNLFTFGSTVSAAANVANIKQGELIHAMIIKRGYESETEISNVLITLFAKCGSIADAYRLFLEMPEKNEVSWNAIITCYSQHGYGREALRLFEEMKSKGVMPNHVTFVGVLSACSHVGLVEEGLNHFNSMSIEHGLIPKPEHYASVVDILGRSGKLGRAREFIEEMEIEPDAMVWRTLLSACRVHKNIEIGEFAARHLLELEPEDSATYVLLANIYAVAGKWNCRDQMRKMMKDRGVKKEPGRSWIEVNNSVHAFFVGDRLHLQTKEIYEFLADLNKRATEIGYVQERYSLWSDMEQGQKDATAYIHSEKLAVSFGLFSSSPAMPIRVMKNLRVCNDCHNWMKFVSKISNRRIVVRDAYRFHHFDGGACSCKDYW